MGAMVSGFCFLFFYLLFFYYFFLKVAEYGYCRMRVDWIGKESSLRDGKQAAEREMSLYVLILGIGLSIWRQRITEYSIDALPR